MKTKTENTVFRDFLIKCRTNRGGKYLAPVSVQEIRLTPEDPDMDYEPIGKPSPYFGEIREHLKKRGDLLELPCGDRITRNPHIGKQVRHGRNGFVFVQVRARVQEWKLFTKRTANPKRAWLMAKCKEVGLRVFIQNKRFMGEPISYVHRDDFTAAWAILAPVDNVRDDDARFIG